MAPKRQSTRVTFVKTVKPSIDTGVRKRKKQGSEEQTSGRKHKKQGSEEQTSGRKRKKQGSEEQTSGRKRKKQSSEEQTSGKRQCRKSPENKVVQLKGKKACPLQEEVIQHIESCINTAVLSVLSKKKVTAFEPIQVHLSRLKQRLLQLCKDMRVPATKLGKLTNLARDVQKEKHRMEEHTDTVEALNHEIEEAVATTEKIEESIVALEGKIETLKQQAPETSQSMDQILNNKDPLQLPQDTFKASTMQDQVKKLENPEVILKELSQVQSNPIYKNVLNLLQTSYAEISTL